MKRNKILLGYIKGSRVPINLYDFEWACGWYWSGGYIGNTNLHTHFDRCFLETLDLRGRPLGDFVTPWNKRDGATMIENGCAIWEPLSTFLEYPKFEEKEWWRIKDLFKQFYCLQKAAGALRYGGHCSASKRNPAEINPDMARAINLHLQDVIIPEIRKAVRLQGENPKMDLTSQIA